MMIFHQSTSVNFAVLYKKPIQIINMDIFDIHFRARINFLANELSVKPLNLSKKYNMNIKWEINEDLYNKYKLNYIKMDETLEKSVWEILLNYIKI